MAIYDVSVTLQDDMVTYPGDVLFRREQMRSIEEGDGVNLSAIHTGVHAGTHIDAPYHMIRDGVTVEAIPPSTLTGPAEVVAVKDPECIGLEAVEGYDWDGVERVLFKTANSGRIEAGEQFIEDFVYLTAEAAEFLADRDLRLVGLDYLSFDPPGATDHPGHIPLLFAGVVLIEGLDLSEVPPGGYELFCGALKVAGGDGAPARVFLKTV